MRRTRQQAGLTLIELTVALAITATLTVASLTTATQLARVEAFQESAEQGGSIAAPLRGLLAMDITPARQWRPTEKGFELRTWSLLDGSTMESRHLPAVVGYEIRPSGGRNWLVRVQQGDSEKDRQVELVSADIKSIRLRASGPAGRPAPTAWRAIPSFVDVTVEFADTGRVAEVIRVMSQ